ncbi:hypothetical protein EYC98_12230 [Halieaceae bacterium IMCC14734]|uniref:Outer membrane protein beta-barrel domain-containing protein n=1 Tax=Candidatus Litorirhabdus singularis TaxID=2518993 RepID=A0ABT3TIQ8_9GAMM|nr:hypothetical protein [Candidatus Litorirhabdus singularis]MCX2981631.1 hypothetical protein [Candidatus Litorirhabdus singularis]
MKKLSTPVILGGILLLSPLAWGSQPGDRDEVHPLLEDKFTFRAGALRNKAEATFIASRPILPETELTLNTLGINQTKTTGWLAFSWRFSERWALNLSYNAFAVEGGRIVDKDFNFDGVQFAAGADIDTSLRADAWVADVSYSFYKSRNLEIGAGLGLHAFDFRTDIDTVPFINENSVERGTKSNYEVIAPVPNLRLYGRLALSNRTAIDIESGLLSLSYDEWSGEFFYISSRLEYRFKNSIGVGIGYQLTDIDLEEARDFGRRHVYDVKFNGTMLYMTYSY